MGGLGARPAEGSMEARRRMESDEARRRVQRAEWWQHQPWQHQPRLERRLLRPLHVPICPPCLFAAGLHAAGLAGLEPRVSTRVGARGRGAGCGHGRWLCALTTGRAFLPIAAAATPPLRQLHAVRCGVAEAYAAVRHRGATSLCRAAVTLHCALCTVRCSVQGAALRCPLCTTHATPCGTHLRALRAAPPHSSSVAAARQRRLHAIRDACHCWREARGEGRRGLGRRSVGGRVGGEWRAGAADARCAGGQPAGCRVQGAGRARPGACAWACARRDAGTRLKILCGRRR